MAQCDFGARVPGSRAHAETMGYISSVMKSYGHSVRLQNFSYHNFLLKRNLVGTNVIADKPGGNDVILLGAHYDTRPFADSPQSSDKSQPVLGANDGASGVAVLLELARILANAELNYTLRFVFLDAEDSGGSGLEGWIVGSTQYVSSLGETERRAIKAAIIVDMVGDRELELKWEGSSDLDLTRAVWEYAKRLGYQQFIDSHGYTLYDDHRPFLEAGIRAIVIIDFDYPFWHTTLDTPDKVSASSLQAVGRTLEFFLKARTDIRENPVRQTWVWVAAVLVALVLILFIPLRRKPISRLAPHTTMELEKRSQQ